MEKQTASPSLATPAVAAAALAEPTPARFWDRRAPAYSRKPVPDEVAYAQTLGRVRAYLTPQDRVLELGCGTGSTALALAANAAEILATDYSAGMLTIASEKARAANVTNIDFRRCSLDDATLTPGSFDVVMAMNLLHLLDDLPARFSRIRSLVRPRGLFLSKTPCLGDQGFLLRVALPLLRAVRFAPFVNFVSERALCADITAAGFEVLETGMYPQKSRSLFVVARRNS